MDRWDGLTREGSTVAGTWVFAQSIARERARLRGIRQRVRRNMDTGLRSDRFIIADAPAEPCS